MDISEQFVPVSALPPPPPRSDAERRRRAWATVVHTLGGLGFAASIPVCLLWIAMIKYSGYCSTVDSPERIAAARWSIFWVGVAWSLLPCALAGVARLLRSNWIVWLTFGCMTFTLGTCLAVTTTELEVLFCF